jgi:hypothetical protein
VKILSVNFMKNYHEKFTEASHADWLLRLGSPRSTTSSGRSLSKLDDTDKTMVPIEFLELRAMR